MTIRDIAIAIGVDVDDGALEKLFDRLSHLRDKKISVQTQATGEDAAIRQAAEEQISDTLRQQDQTMQGILQKEQQINQEGKKKQQHKGNNVNRLGCRRAYNNLAIFRYPSLHQHLHNHPGDITCDAR